MANQHPVILVHGIFGFGPNELRPLSYWGNALRVKSPLRRHEASVGPISSAHDRACELAAQIKGTVVDYGERHADDAGHDRYGRDYSADGFARDWDETRPVHLVGHSLGSPTIRCLQHLLEADYWRWGSNHRWVKSISTISGVTNGSTLTYLAGADQRSGLLDERSAARALMLLIETYMYATHAIRESIYNFDLGYWGFDREPGELLVTYLLRVGHSGFMTGKDNAAYTLTLQGAYEDNQVWRTYEDTYYFSYITEQTFRGFSGHYYPSQRMGVEMRPMAYYMGRKDFWVHPIPVENFLDSDWWENDGMVSTYSQMYPRTAGDHPVGGEFSDETPNETFEPGKWYYRWMRDMDHLDVCLSPEPLQISRRRDLYVNLYERLAAL